jgi:hypothetical protein
MPYAADNRISTSPIDGGVEITDAEYKEALEKSAQGYRVAVRDGALRYLSWEKRTVYSIDDKSKLEIPENDDTPDGYTDAEPGEWDYWGGSAWAEDADARLAHESSRRLEDITAETTAIDAATVRPASEIAEAHEDGVAPDAGDVSRLKELRDAARYLRGKYQEIQDATDPAAVTIDWPAWRR